MPKPNLRSWEKEELVGAVKKLTEDILNGGWVRGLTAAESRIAVEEAAVNWIPDAGDIHIPKKKKRGKKKR